MRNILALLLIAILFILLFNFNLFSDFVFYTFCYFIGSLKVWKKPKYNLLRNKCLRNILREKNQNIEKQLEQRKKKKWKKFIDQPNYGYYILNENPGEKSVIEPPQIIDRVQSTDNLRSKSHKNVTVRKGKKNNYAEIVRGCSSRNNKGLKVGFDRGH